jgi:hypothetical protein
MYMSYSAFMLATYHIYTHMYTYIDIHIYTCTDTDADADANADTDRHRHRHRHRHTGTQTQTQTQPDPDPDPKPDPDTPAIACVSARPDNHLPPAPARHRCDVHPHILRPPYAPPTAGLPPPTAGAPRDCASHGADAALSLPQYLYFCTSTGSKVSTSRASCSAIPRSSSFLRLEPISLAYDVSVSVCVYARARAFLSKRARAFICSAPSEDRGLVSSIEV